MNFTKIIVGVITGAIFTAISLAISFYIFQKNTNASGPLGPASNFAVLGIIFGIIYGAVVGSISGWVITGFQLHLLRAIVFGLLFNLILGVGLSPLGTDMFEKFIYVFLIPSLIGAANAIIVSLISSSSKSFN